MPHLSRRSDPYTVSVGSDRSADTGMFSLPGMRFFRGMRLLPAKNFLPRCGPANRDRKLDGTSVVQMRDVQIHSGSARRGSREIVVTCDSCGGKIPVRSLFRGFLKYPPAALLFAWSLMGFCLPGGWMKSAVGEGAVCCARKQSVIPWSGWFLLCSAAITANPFVACQRQVNQLSDCQRILKRAKQTAR